MPRYGPDDVLELARKLKGVVSDMTIDLVNKFYAGWLDERTRLLAALDDVEKLAEALAKIRDTAKSWEGRSDAPFWNLGDIATGALKKRKTMSADSVIRHIQKNERKLDVVEIEYAAERWWIRLGTPKDGVVPAVGEDLVQTYAQALANWEARKPTQEDKP